jgi:hypothetical protein
MRQFLLVPASIVVAMAGMGDLPASASYAQPSPLREVTVTSDSVPGWSPTVEQEAQVRQALAAYFAALDAGRYEAAYALTNDGYQTHETQPAFAEREARMRTAVGPVRERRVLKVTWSKNPKLAPQDGVYAAVDLASRFAEADRHCGYIMLRQPAEGGPFQVNNLLQAYLDNKTAESIVGKQSITALDAVWAQAASACPNYTALVAQAPLPESKDGGVGYPSVAAALAALRAQPGVNFRSENGWTIAEDTKNTTIWSFAPAGNPAYPAAVKRQIISEGGGASLQMAISCEAAKEPCDALVRQFQQLNNVALSGRQRAR